MKNEYWLRIIRAKAVEHLDENYYSDIEGNNFNYTDTTYECIEMAIESALETAKNDFLKILEDKEILNPKVIKDIEQRFNEKYDI